MNSKFVPLTEDSTLNTSPSVSNGGASTEKDASSKYKFLQYPDGLGTTRYPHFVTFYMNVNGKSKIARADGTVLYDKDLTKSANLGAAGGTNNPNSQTEKTTSGASDSGDNKIFGVDYSGVKKFVKDTYTTSYKRLGTAISLPFPVNVTHNYGATYEQSQSGILGTAFRQIASGQGFAKVTGDATDAMAQHLPKSASIFAGGAIGGMIGKVTGVNKDATAITGSVAAAVNSDNFNNILSKLAGVAQNENAEQVFKRMQFRTFQFDYMFTPKSPEETTQIQEIIKMFKERMHPELSENENLLIMPDEFDIEFRYMEEENIFIGKIATCVLSGITINSAPIGHWVGFDGSMAQGGGAPVAIQMSLQFTEMEPLVRGMISRGY